MPVASNHRRLTALRLALISSAALALLAGAAQPAAAQFGTGFYSGGGWYGGRSYYAPARRHRSSAAKLKGEKSDAKKETGFGEMPKGPLQLVVSIGTQTVTLFSNGVRVAQGPVSTGVTGHPTPMGVFSVIEKDRYHHSNLYSNAPMPYMQRITWSGVALHEGVLPGHPASHGCIRMSHDFAQKLWRVTKLGVRVIVARHELAPVDFAHPNLFKPKPPEPSIAIGVTDGHSRAPAAVAQAGIADAESGGIGAPPQAAAATDAPAPANGNGAAPRSSEAAPRGTDLPQPAPTVDPAKPPRIKVAEEPITRSGQVAVFVSRKEQKIFVRQGFVPLFDMPLVIDQPDQPLGTHVFTAMEVTENGGGMRWNVITMPTQASTPPEQRDGKKRSKAALNAAPRPKPPPTPAEALDRIQMPQEAVERIAELLVPGSSLVVSDEGLGPETGRYTEFVVLAH